MEIEYEATFANINKDQVREKLKQAGAKLMKPEIVMKRVVLWMPKGHEIEGGWLRVRDEGDKITMTFKVVDGNEIHNQKEINLTIDNFNNGVAFLESVGAKRKSYQETKREIWMIGNVEVMIDEWPYLEPFVEVEGKSEEEVQKVSEKLGFDYAQAKFCAVDTLYYEKYKVTKDYIDNNIAKITFEMENPFEKIKK